VSSNSQGAAAGWKWGALALLAIALLVIWRPGCRYYPPVTSPEGMQLVKLLYAACNTRDQARLSMAEKQFADLVGQEKVTPREKTAFESIISLAKAGKWEEAERASFRFAEDQIGRGHPSKERHADDGDGQHSHSD
jgi:hypothetical protein